MYGKENKVLTKDELTIFLQLLDPDASLTEDNTRMLLALLEYHI